MVLLIDAYNILKQIYPNILITQRQRMDFIRLIARYCIQRMHTAIIVFDGGPDSQPLTITQNHVTIIYAGNKTADSIIEKYIAEHKGEIVVVTQDRQLRSYAEHYKLVVLDSIEFYNVIKNSMQSTISREKKQKARRFHEASPGLDELMEEASQHMLIKAEENFADGLKKNKLSKEEKKIYKVIKKL